MHYLYKCYLSTKVIKFLFKNDKAHFRFNVKKKSFLLRKMFELLVMK